MIYTVATGCGVLETVAMAASRFADHDAETPQEQIHAVSVLEDPKGTAGLNDLIDY